jgi:hypothetical protein
VSKRERERKRGRERERDKEIERMAEILIFTQGNLGIQ